MLALTLLLVSLAAANPIPDIPAEGRLLSPRQDAEHGGSSTILWRGGGDRITLMSCAGGGPNGNRNGDPVQIGGSYFRYCNPYWTAGSNLNQGPNRCMDSTLNPGNGVKPHMWTCYDGAWQQQWRYHSDGTIRLDGRNLCLDVTDGDPTKDVQMWECFPGNRNQQFDV